MEPKSPVIVGYDKQEIKIAEHQEEYTTLPALIGKGGLVMSRWEPTLEERERIMLGADIYVGVLTGGAPLQPLIVIPDFKEDAPNVLDVLLNPPMAAGKEEQREQKERNQSNASNSGDGPGSEGGKSGGQKAEAQPEPKRTRSGRTTGQWNS